MSTVYYVHRLPPDLAVDLLCVRRRFQDMDHEDLLGPYQRYTEPPQPEVPRTVNFRSGYSNVDIAMLAGPDAEGIASSLWGWFCQEETNDVRVWSTRGARLVGWHVLELPLIPGATQFPYRYSLPTDISRIQEVLDTITVAELQANLAECLHRGMVRADELQNMSTSQIIDNVPRRFLEMLRRFYDEAEASGEIVIYNLR